MVYVARNPKDVIVSFYHHHKLFKFYGFSAEIDVFADYFMRDLSACCFLFLPPSSTGSSTNLAAG